MRQFVLPVDFAGEPEIEIAGEDAHYLARVLRLKVGHSIPGTDRSGYRYHLTLTEVAPNRCRLRVQRKGEPLTYEPTIELYQGIPKGKKLEQIIRSCTEAGVSRITPVHSRYSVPRIEAAAAEAKTRRRRKIAEEAVQQSGAAGVPDVALPIPLSEIPPAGAKLGLFFHQEPLADSSLHGYLYGTPTEISIVVGPEGGFSESEVAMLEQRGYQAVYLGPRVLRTETAALYAIAAIQVIQMEHEKWTRA